jgi:cytochrome c
MVRKSGLVCLNIWVFAFLFAFARSGNFFGKKNIQQVNQPPVVKIINPKNNSSFDWDAPLNYEITVADKEDGDSKYDEINAKEVLLEVRCIANKTRLQAILYQGVKNDAPGLAVIRSSNCFNCHNFNSKAIGPSFYAICKRYPASKPNVDSLVKHIRNGSSGIWVKEKMPSHPELSAEETKNAVQWILKNAANPAVNYYIGLQGSIRIKQPAASIKKGIYILTASYTDHGLKDVPGKRLKGQDVVVLYGK